MNSEQVAPIVYDLNFFILSFGFVAGFMVFFTVIFFLVCKLVSLRGWQAYSVKYPGNASFPDDVQSFTWQSLMIGGNVAPANYQFVATGAFNDDGLFLKMGAFFKAFHPPLFIPWSDVESIDQKKAIKGVYTVIQCPGVSRLVIFRKFGDAVFAQWHSLQKN